MASKQKEGSAISDGKHLLKMLDTTIIKDKAGEMTLARVAGSPHKFLYKRFPTWKEDRKTYMIPPFFNAKGIPRIGIKKSDMPYSLREDLGEGIVFDLLQQLGELKNIGMFVVHGFQLEFITSWKKKVAGHLVDWNFPKSGEYDFIIFHHTLGVILIEVKYVQEIKKGHVEKGEDELDKSLNLVKTLAISDMTEDSFHLIHRRVIAFPCIEKQEFRREKFSKLKDDTFLLFKEDCKNIDSFQKWWNEVIESTDNVPMTPHIQETYELVLSYVLMIRHLGPITESDSISILHHCLLSYKYYGNEAHPQIVKKKFPKFWKWCHDILYKKDANYNFGAGDPVKIKEDYLSCFKFSCTDLIALMEHLEKQLLPRKYINGDTPAIIDREIALLFEDTYFHSFENILRFINTMRQKPQIEEQEALPNMKKYPFLKLKSMSDCNQLDRHLSKSSFMEGTKPTSLDQHVFEKLTRQERSKHPLIFTTEQLAVFEGPCKQLIIGPPGSGKSELMKFKAIELEREMKACKREKKILYIVANGSRTYKESLFFYHTKDFFSKLNSTLVDVVAIILEEKSPMLLQETISNIRRKIESKEYDHAFVDEYWVGCKPAEHQIILELIQGIPGYMWITSVFDINPLKCSNDRMQRCTLPLIKSLEQCGGGISRIHQILRATNSIIKLEREYGGLYQGRSYPYGTKEVLGHHLEGLPISWIIEKGLDCMYTRCADIIDSALTNTICLDAIHKKKLTLDAGDIMIVNFAVRIKESLSIKLEYYLENKNIPFWSIEGSLEQLLEGKRGKVTLLQSFTRDISSYLDGVEWPMMIIILPSGLVLGTAELANKDHGLRNYDPFISFFRTMVKLVVISDKWQESTEFIADRMTNI